VLIISMRCAEVLMITLHGIRSGPLPASPYAYKSVLPFDLTFYCICCWWPLEHLRCTVP
jgi:hypothetical protein